ncbi:MAG: hypothetical protein EPN36_10190 [Rhodanobacteraceae bacterium]|nr:MAG: hypothetical protein EPN36_10190 [Rhodanobacteraceae bacterium]
MHAGSLVLRAQQHDAVAAALVPLQNEGSTVSVSATGGAYACGSGTGNLMQVFLDTEFVDWNDPETDLISIGMVAEDGREFYAECTEFDLGKCTDFVTLEVLPLLGAEGVLQAGRNELKYAVFGWLATIPEPEIAVDYDGDWLLLARLLGQDMPANLTVTNVWESLDKQKLEDYFLLHTATRHHALHDARANRWAVPERR